jgi:ABC-2 type transport system permease protein
VSATGVSVEGLGKPIKGPSALGTDPRRLWHLTWTLAVTEWKLRFFGSVLGYLWQLLRPLAVFGVLYVVFTNVFGADELVTFYPEALLLGIVMFTFFNEATKGCVSALVEREPLVRKVEFPRLAIPLSIVITATFNLALNLLPLIVFLLIDGGSIRWTWLELPVIVVLLAAFSVGIGMLLSAMFVRYRDVAPIWDVVLQVMFYAVPVFYPIELVISKGYEKWARVIVANPFAAALQQARYAVLGPGHLSEAAALGLSWRLVFPIGAALGVFALGAWVFSKRAPTIAEDL